MHFIKGLLFSGDEVDNPVIKVLLSPCDLYKGTVSQPETYSALECGDHWPLKYEEGEGIFHLDVCFLLAGS